VGLLLCGTWSFIAITLASQKANLVEERQRQLAHLNSAVAQQTAGLLRYVEINLRVLDRYLQANPTINPRTDRRFIELVNMLQRYSRGLTDIRMVSGRGEIYYMPAPDGTTITGLQDRTVMAQLAPGTGKFHIGHPIRSRVSGKWEIPISWRLDAPAAGIDVMVASIELEEMFVLHERMRLKPAGTIMLINDGGVILSRTPYQQSLIGKNISASPNFQSAYGVKASGTFMTGGTITDGVRRLASFERLDDYPVVVLVTEGLKEVLAPYQTRSDLTFALTAVVTMMILTLTVFLQRFIWAMHGAQENLERRALIDSLTGTLRRGEFLEIAQREFSRARRYERPAVIAAIDLDHFKTVNDTNGHAAGDAVLRECCNAWKTVLRSQDFLGRVGGEEFCAILPETTLEGARQVAERLREATEMLRFPGEAGEFSVTVSIGLTTIVPSDQQLLAVMERADKALYAAKHAGRNRVELLEPRRLRAVPLRPANAPR
jgi:diguanylate cyclase (GGDEF)-like protein